MPSVVSKENQRVYACGCRGVGRLQYLSLSAVHPHFPNSFVAINYGVIKAERQC